MDVFKFGGASVKNAQAIKNVASIINNHSTSKKIIVVSAIGNTTNTLEEIVEALKTKNDVTFRYLVNELYKKHLAIADQLLKEQLFIIQDYLEQIFVNLGEQIHKNFSENEDFEYDQIVSTGEFLSSKILHAFLVEQGLKTTWIDARNVIRTNNNYRNALVDWDKTNELIQQEINQLTEATIFVTQGFIGSTREGMTTTLGREGSDYTAAIFAHCINADNVTIWKDVPGMLNADPKWFDDTIQLHHISFQEAIELSYYGANVIHPKTIKPLQNKNIPLFVKSFIDPTLPGTIIDNITEHDTLIPSFIFKMNQLKISITPKDFSFIVEESLSDIFTKLSSLNTHINLMQNSAISFDFVVNERKGIKELLENKFGQDYNIFFDDKLELVTIRHYDQQTIDRVTVDKEIILTQQSQQTTRMLMRDLY